MQLFTLARTLDEFIQAEKSKGTKIGFVPTMGALHEGHLSLIRLAQSKADVVLCSIFVNPKQFNNQDDLIKYPRMFDRDAWLLEKEGCEVLFVPPYEEVYPEGLQTELMLDLGILDQVMEGEFRPGHFKGMLQVVKRLLDLTSADILVMGQKDFQQFTLVHHMIRQLGIPCKLVIGETSREADGLAMSSRNLRLTRDFRQKAALIYEVLQLLKKEIGHGTVANLELDAARKLDSAGFRTEYVRIVDGLTLEPVILAERHEYIVACIATWAGEVRLIDNLILKGGL